jgi:hypothetical protein
MIKKLFIVLLMAAPLVAGNEGGRKRFDRQSFSVYAGPLWSKYSRLPDVDTIPEIRGVLASYTGVAVGISWQFRLGNHFVADAGVEVAQRGTTVNWYEFEELRNKWVYSLLMYSYGMRLRYKPLHGSSPYIFAGNDLSLLSYHDLTDYANPDNPTKTNLNWCTLRFDIGIFAGAGVEIVLRKLVPFVEVRYQHDLLDVSKGTGPLESYPVIKTRAFVVLAGIRFRSKRKVPE